MTLAEDIAKMGKENERVQSDLGNVGSLTFFLNLHNETLTLTNPYTITSTRTLGSSFILGHPGLGWIGPVVAASAACGSQPYLGDSRSAWLTKEIHSTSNKWIETFDGSRFKASATTADWTEVGSIHFTNAEIMQTESIYLGSRALSSIRLEFEGSTYDNISLEASPDGGNNWETVNSASVTIHTFTNTGSDLQLKFTAAGDCVLTKVGIKYGLD